MEIRRTEAPRGQKAADFARIPIELFARMDRLETQVPDLFEGPAPIG
jgi:hypothetical protein